MSILIFKLFLKCVFIN
uniref:Uncharacterized protein n=1 Tax=Anguilla anguilla TaxID=7936 RepID=A0A0E9Q6Q1_ANGAN